MNLRHSKPSFSYSECAPEVKEDGPRVKEDPMSRYHAQLLLNFVARVNQKYLQSQARKKVTKNAKGKCKSKVFQRDNDKKDVKQSEQSALKVFAKKKASNHQATMQHPDLSPDFLDTLLKLAGQVQLQQGDTDLQDLPYSSLVAKLKHLLKNRPQYLPSITSLYSQGYYIQGLKLNSPLIHQFYYQLTQFSHRHYFSGKGTNAPPVLQLSRTSRTTEAANDHLSPPSPVALPWAAWHSCRPFRWP